MPRSFGFAPFLRHLVGVALLLAAAGCSSQPQVVARVGPTVITVATFEEVARNARSRYPGPPEEAKAQLLEYLVNRELLVLEGRRTNAVPDSLVQRFRRDAEERTLGRALIERIVPHGAEPPVSEAEVRRFYEWRKIGARCRLIYTPDRRRADGALEALRHGESFEQVSERFSLPGVLLPGARSGS